MNHNLFKNVLLATMFFSCSLLKKDVKTEDWLQTKRVKSSKFKTNNNIENTFKTIYLNTKRCYDQTTSKTSVSTSGGGTTHHTYTTNILVNKNSFKKIESRFRMHTSMHDYKMPVLVIELSATTPNSTEVTTYYSQDIIGKIAKKWVDENSSACPEHFNWY